MSRVLHVLAIVVLIVASLVAVSALGFRAWLATDGGQRWMGGQIDRHARQLGLSVKFRRLSGTLFSGAQLEDVTLASQDNKLRVRAPRVALDWSLASLLDGRPRVHLRVERPDIRLTGPPSLKQLPKLPEGGKFDAEIVDGRLRGRRLDGSVRAKYFDGDGQLHAELRWGRDRATIDGSLHGGEVALSLRDLRMSPALARSYLPTWVGVPRAPLTGSLTVRGPLDRLQVNGAFRAGRGRMKLVGRASVPQERAQLRVTFRGVEPDLLPARERMVLDGSAQLALKGRRARFVVDGKYHHRRPDVQVPGASFSSPAGGTLSGRGTFEARRRNLQGRFVMRVRDRGQAARLTSPQQTAPREVLLRGAYEKRPRQNPALRIQTEPQ